MSSASRREALFRFGLPNTEDVRKCLLFAKKYPNEWNTFSRDARTLKAVRALSRGNDHFEVSWKTSQFRYNT
jgi:hypothetical protein